MIRRQAAKMIELMLALGFSTGDGLTSWVFDFRAPIFDTQIRVTLVQLKLFFFDVMCSFSSFGSVPRHQVDGCDSSTLSLKQFQFVFWSRLVWIGLLDSLTLHVHFKRKPQQKMQICLACALKRNTHLNLPPLLHVFLKLPPPPPEPASPASLAECFRAQGY